MAEERWKTIPDFPNYSVSDLGNIWNNKFEHPMQVSKNNYGHLKITLTNPFTGERKDRSVAKLVAEAFVSPPNRLCDRVVVLDGRLDNVAAENLMWRPRYFAWKYIHQLKQKQPLHYNNLPVKNLDTKAVYPTIVVCGMTEGLLFDDIWRSTYTQARIFPHGHVYAIDA